MQKQWSFEKLKVFQLAYQASCEIHKASLDFLKIEQYGGIADQLRRSSKSVCANLVEGQGKQAKSKAEFVRFIWIAIGSADETRLWLKYAHDFGYIPSALYEKWDSQYSEIAAMLYGLAKRNR